MQGQDQSKYVVFPILFSSNLYQFVRFLNDNECFNTLRLQRDKLSFKNDRESQDIGADFQS